MKTRRLLPLVLILAVGVTACSDRQFRQSGSSAMLPTIQPNEVVMADMSAYRKSGPNRWDVIVFHPTPAPTARPGEFWVMRVIGLPGEELEIREDGVYIAGHQQTPPKPISDIRYIAHAGARSSVSYPLRIPVDSYFVVGDNTKNSFDSRFWGPLPLSNILGKVRNK
jgi:signal peptidase I